MANESKPYVVEVRVSMGVTWRDEVASEKEAFAFLKQIENGLVNIPSADIFHNGKRVFGQSASKRFDAEAYYSEVM